MSFKTTCPNCSQRFEATDEHVGMEVQCSTCSMPFIIKAPTPPIIRRDLPERKTIEILPEILDRIKKDNENKKVSDAPNRLQSIRVTDPPRRKEEQPPLQKKKRGFWAALFDSSTQPIVEHTIRFGKFGTHGVKTDWYVNESNEALIASLLLYTSMYFYAGEHRVVEATAQAIENHLENDGENTLLTEDIYDAIREVFSYAERDAVDGVFEYGKPFRLADFNSYESKDHILKTISTKSLKINESKWVATISVGFGLDIVVLPLGIGILYNYILNKLSSQERVCLKSGLNSLCYSWTKGYCKKLENSRASVNEIINENLKI